MLPTYLSSSLPSLPTLHSALPINSLCKLWLHGVIIPHLPWLGLNQPRSILCYPITLVLWETLQALLVIPLALAVWGLSWPCNLQSGHFYNWTVTGCLYPTPPKSITVHPSLSISGYVSMNEDLSLNFHLSSLDRTHRPKYWAITHLSVSELLLTPVYTWWCRLQCIPTHKSSWKMGWWPTSQFVPSCLLTLDFWEAIVGHLDLTFTSLTKKCSYPNSSLRYHSTWLFIST